MIQCPKCSADNSDDSRFCKTCGQEITSISQVPTVAAPEGEAPPSPVDAPHVGRIVSSDSVPAGGFTPGTILADRYRIIGLLGRGGMGEVYRADDLKLGQPVALKFLPPKLADDPVRRERFFAEVRITRQLSHPNICRVYDIGEVDGRHFLSMEYIDGEDLASLMKRIGHLSNEKALDIARQLVAGLAVAHERGVLHRDLKPANIMLDGHGRVRITDFGLAIAAEDEAQAEEIAGTPAYMAPEQLAGKGATVRSDIYSLGLILYEIYTGKKAFKARTLAELREQKETQIPRALSELRDGIDPVVERVIQRCMEKDPNARPTSVAQLAQALPGGDPLAAAIAAGETPSPEMVAASGSKEGLRPAISWGLLAFIIIGLVATLVMRDRIFLNKYIPADSSPEALVERSHEILKNLDLKEKYQDSIYGYMINSRLLNYLETLGEIEDLRKNLDPKAMLFWYRESPRSLNLGLTIGTITIDTPPLQHPGEILVILDAKGRLVSLRRVPSPASPKTETVPPLDWDLLFAEAGLNQTQWDRTESQWIPNSYADEKVVWEGSLRNFPEARARIEAASFQGKPVNFSIVGPWAQSEQIESTQEPLSSIVSLLGYALVFLLATTGGIFFARRNIRLGRGDRRSAYRLAFFVLVINILMWAFTWYQASIVNLLLIPYLGILIWIYYIALEPYVRRRWPQILVSWTRLLSGKWRDPLVAREILIGCAFAVFVSFMHIVATQIFPSRFFSKNSLPTLLNIIQNIMADRSAITTFLDGVTSALLISLATLCVFVFLRILFRNQIVTIAVCVVFITMGAGPRFGYGSMVVYGIIFFFALIRFGFIAAFLFQLTSTILTYFTLDVSAWYSGNSYLLLAIFSAIVLYAFHTSLGGRPMFGTPRLDE